MLACKCIFTTTTKGAARVSGDTRYAYNGKVFLARHTFYFFESELEQFKKQK